MDLDFTHLLTIYVICKKGEKKIKFWLKFLPNGISKVMWEPDTWEKCEIWVQDRLLFKILLSKIWFIGPPWSIQIIIIHKVKSFLIWFTSFASCLNMSFFWVWLYNLYKKMECLEISIQCSENVFLDNENNHPLSSH